MGYICKFSILTVLPLLINGEMYAIVNQIFPVEVQKTISVSKHALVTAC